MKAYGIIKGENFQDTIFGQSMLTYRPKSGKVDIIMSIDNKEYSKIMDIKKVNYYTKKAIDKMNTHTIDTIEFYNRFNQAFAVCAKMIKI